MANVYGQLSKISDARGRSKYLTGKNQEEIVLHDFQMTSDWNFYHEYEKNHAQPNGNHALPNGEDKHREALEIIVALPNELYQSPKLKKVCDDLCHSLIQGNNDYEYAVHWNHNRTNLHMHLLFSEREKVIEREPKVYKKDIWQDRDTHKLAKANAENAILVHKKGEVQKDNEGNIKYNDEPLKAKNLRFKYRSFIQDKNDIIQGVLNRYGFDLAVQDKTTPYLSQLKLYKGASEDYLEHAKAYNSAVRKYNKAVREHIRIDPDKEFDYRWDRQRIEDTIRFENSFEKKITPSAIQYILEMKDKVVEVINQLKAKREAKKILAAPKVVTQSPPEIIKSAPKPQPVQAPRPELRPQKFENEVYPEKKESVREKLARLEKEAKMKKKEKRDKGWER